MTIMRTSMPRWQGWELQGRDARNENSRPRLPG